MSKPARLILLLLWIVSLVAVNQWTARAQQNVAPGGEVRFVQAKTVNGVIVGHLMANVGGAWVPVEVNSVIGGGAVPLGQGVR